MRIAPAWVLLCALVTRAQDPSALERAVSLQRSGQTEESISLLRDLLKTNPTSPEVHNCLGVAHLQKNSFAEAEAEFREAIRLNPAFVRAYNNLGSTLAQAGDIARGIEVLRQGLEHAPADFQLRLNLAMALRSKGDAPEALELFRSLLREHAEESALHYQYGQTLRQKGDLDGAMAAFEKALELEPESVQASYALGQALRQSSARATRLRGPSDLLKAGTQALSRGDLSSAREAAQKAVASDSTSAEAHHLLGFALWYGGDRKGAAEALDRALELNPAAADVLSFRGMAYRESGDLAQARRMLLRSIALDSKRPLPYIDLAVVFLRLGDLDRSVGQFEAGLNLPAAQKGLPDLDLAIRDLRLAIAKKPDNADAQRVLGRLLGASGADPAQVIAAFQKAAELRPDDAEARNSLGLVYVQAGDDEKAIAAFREAVKLRPNFADARQNLGAVLTTSDVAEAVQQLETAVKLQPQLLKAQYNLALAYEASPQHGPGAAVEQIRRLLSAEPDYPRAHFVLGRALLRQGQVEPAVEELRRAVDREPEFGEARYQLGLALSRAGRREEGNVEIRRGRELIAANENRQAAALDLVAAKAALEKGDSETAAAKARKILGFQPESAEARAVLNAALVMPLTAPPPPTASIEHHIRQGNFAQAEQEARAYLASQPKSAWAWYALGYSLYAQKRIGDSIKALAQSLQLDVNNPDAHKVLGRDLMIIGRFDAAKIEFEQGKRLNPKSAEMPYNLGKLYSIQDNWADARREFEAAVRLDPAYMEAHDGLGFALEALGDDEGAAASYRKAIELCETRRAGFASPYVNMSALSNRSGEHAAALEYASKGLAANPQSDRALFHMAKAHEYQGDLKAAADALSRAIELNPRSSSYFYVLATVYRKLGKPDESRKAMESFTRLDRESNELEQKRRDFLSEK